MLTVHSRHNAQFIDRLWGAGGYGTGRQIPAKCLHAQIGWPIEAVLNDRPDVDWLEAGFRDCLKGEGAGSLEEAGAGTNERQRLSWVQRVRRLAVGRAAGTMNMRAWTPQT